MSNLARQIILDELIENSHAEKVEDVIFWALEEYSKKQTTGGVIAFAIKSRIEDSEKQKNPVIQNIEKVNLIDQ